MAHQPTVFVVDDDSGVRRSLRALGRSHGLTVETYASAQAFLVAYDPDRPGCLLLDVRLLAATGSTYRTSCGSVATRCRSSS